MSYFKNMSVTWAWGSFFLNIFVIPDNWRVSSTLTLSVIISNNNHCDEIISWFHFVYLSFTVPFPQNTPSVRNSAKTIEEDSSQTPCQKLSQSFVRNRILLRNYSNYAKVLAFLSLFVRDSRDSCQWYLDSKASYFLSKQNTQYLKFRNRFAEYSTHFVFKPRSHKGVKTFLPFDAMFSPFLCQLKEHSRN